MTILLPRCKPCELRKALRIVTIYCSACGLDRIEEFKANKANGGLKL